MVFRDDMYSGNYSMETLETAQSNRRESRLVDLRKSPRVDTHLQGVMITELDEFKGDVTNLSRSGLRFETHQVPGEDFVAVNRQADPATPTIVELKFSVPGSGEGVQEVIVAARLVYILGDADTGYQLGVEFRRFATGNDALVDYLRMCGA